MKNLLSRRRSMLATSFLLVLTFAGAQVHAQTVQEPSPDSSTPVNTSDPYESWNRRVFSFNDAIDRWFLRPVAQAYRTVTPDIVDRGVTNFFNNLTEIRNFSNSLLQLKGESAVVAAGRFTYNTVFGLGGIFDVATAFELPERPEDFGQTLGYWGLGSGPYLMLPLLGPATPRYVTGMATDGFLLPSAWDEVDSPETYYLRGLQLVDRRADFIPAEQFISGDRYTFVRNAFLQRREFLINDGKIMKDPFADDDDFMLDDF
ncbi:MlaA family lipoprotein [Marinobacter halophilus]|uniref:ABC transporter n=1 Tax=Marinobacter halophilus TaxID=1323740 RepID=A0A2T1K8G2_9GAMM|nr:VacJ family lipoprotein [Marinobacter halophilus]PSF06426.1 hypothetical protein C7H08_15035 [Marinobacter halophilus]GGC72512.1 hypothetical protein GCM10011362_21240 [Marinobacter halophilus]